MDRVELYANIQLYVNDVINVTALHVIDFSAAPTSTVPANLPVPPKLSVITQVIQVIYN